MRGRTSPRRLNATARPTVCASVSATLFLVAALVGCQHTPHSQCALHLPKIDPTGNRLFTTDTPYRQLPGPMGSDDMTAVMVTPAKIIAPVGSEVVVQAAVCGQDRTLMANEKVEWTLAPGAVGYFVQAGETGPLEWFHHASYHTRKIDNTFAVSATSPKFVMLNRGTPDPGDDVPVLRGQAWVTVSSPLEGQSYVSAVAPDVYGWNSRKQTATIYWVDAEWTFPPPAINPAGSRHVFTTTLVRHSNRCPLAGWRVRYEISGGPGSGFAPDGVRSIEVPTNSLGQATVEIFQPQPGPGTNNINVTIIRPADWPGADGSPLAVGSGATQMTWTASSSGVSIDKSGPNEVGVGGTATYRIVVRNGSDLSAKGVVVTDAVPTGLNFLGATPQATVVGSNLSWQLGDLPAGQSRQIELSFQAQQAAVVNNCATVRTADGATAQDCAVTTITQSSVDIQMVGPPQAAVGEEVTFTATISNRSSQTATGLVLVDKYDPGLKHDVSPSPIENRALGSLAPGETKSVNVKLRAIQPGRWCNTMDLSGDNGIRGSAQACVTAIQSNVPVVPPVVTPPPTTPANPGTLPVLTIRKTGPAKAAVGDSITFSVIVENVGSVPATNVRLVDSYDLAMKATSASQGFLMDAQNVNVYWNLPVLQPGQTYERRIQCLCQTPAARACNRATVTCQEGARQDTESCLEITGRRDPLTVTVSDRRDPIAIGDEAAYEIRVTNNSNVSDGEVIVLVTLPNETTPAAGSTGPTQFALSPNGRALRFAPVAELRPGETLTYSIRATARVAGSSVLRVDVTSNSAPTPVTVNESTTVIAQ